MGNRIVSWPFNVTKKDFTELLKDYNKVNFQKIHKEGKVGVINGMWAGRLGIGGILPIESSWIPSKERNYVKATGSLEKVIKEIQFWFIILAYALLLLANLRKVGSPLKVFGK